MADSTLAFDILARDKASSAFDKVARSADKTSAALKRSVKISDDVAKAEARLSKARDGEADAMGRVKVAEQRLQEFRDRGLEGTSRFTAAEEQLSSARRKAAQASNTAKTAEDSLGKARAQLVKSAEAAGKDAGHSFGKGFGDGAEKEGSKTGKNFNQSLRKWFSPSSLGKVGKEGGTVFGSGFLGALKTPVLGPAIVGTLGAAVAVAAPAVGSIAAGGLVLGFGAGLAGLGLVTAAKSKAAKDAWSKALDEMGAETTRISKPYEHTLVAMSGITKRTFDKFAPSLEASFKETAPVVTRFVDQVAHGLERLQPAVRPLSEAFGRVLDSLGPAIQDAIGNVSDGLIDLSASVKKNPDGLADLTRNAGDLTGSLLNLVSALNNIHGATKAFFSDVPVVGSVLDKANISAIGYAKIIAGAVVPGLGAATNATDLFAGSTDKATGAVGLTGSAMSMYTQGLDQNAVKAILAGKANTGAGASVAALAAKFDAQWQATQRSNDALSRQSNLLLTLSGSEIAYQQAVDDATAAVKANGKTHDLNTQKGRDNQRALDAVAASAIAQTAAMRNAGDGNVKAAKAAETGRAAFIKLATQMGYTVPEAKRMADSLIKIPNVTRTAKLTANKKDLEKKLADAKTELANPNLTKERRAKLTADKKNAEAGIAAVNRALGNLPKSKTVTLTTNVVTKFTTIGSRSSGAGFGGGHEARAAGGPVRAGVPYIVGEHRPELFVPKQDGTIVPRVPRATTGAAYAAGGGQQRLTLEFKSGGSRFDDLIVQLLRQYIRVNGGSPEKVLGRR